MQTPPLTFSIPKALTTLLKTLSMALIACLLVVFILLITLLVSPLARVYVLNTALDIVNSDKLKFEIQSIESPSLNHWRIAELNIQQEGQSILQLRNIVLRWQAQDLLSKKLNIEEITVEELILRYTNFASNEDQSTEKKERITIAQFIDLSNRYNINASQLQVNKLQLEGLHLNNKPLPIYTITSSLNLQPGAPVTFFLLAEEYSVNVENTSASRLSISAESTTKENIELSLQFNDKAGGYWSDYLRLPETQLIDANLNLQVNEENNAYVLKLEKLEFPIDQHQITATSELRLSQDFLEGELLFSNIIIDKQTHKIEGTWSPSHYMFNLQINQFPLSILSPWKSPLSSGYLRFNGKINGSNIENLKTEGSAHIQTHYKNQPLTISARGNGSFTEIVLEEFEGTFGESQTSGKGSLDIVDRQLDIQGNIAKFDIEYVRLFGVDIPKDLQLNIEQADIDLQGPLTNPDGDLQLNAKGQYHGNAFTFYGDVNKRQNQIKINQAKLDLVHGSSEVTGQINTGVAVDNSTYSELIEKLNGKLSGHFSELPTDLVELTGLNIPEGLDATINGNFSLDGKLKQPGINIESTLSGHYQDIPFTLTAIAKHKDLTTNIEQLQLTAFNDSVLDVTGKIKKGILDIDLQAQELPTRLLQAFNLSIKPGDFNAKININGALPLPQIHGNIQYKTKIFKEFKNAEKITNKLAWDLEIESDTSSYTLHSSFSHDSNPPDIIEFYLPLAPYQNYLNTSTSNRVIPLVADIKGGIDLHALSLFLDPELHYIKGRLQTEIQLEGDILSPKFTGDIELIDSSYENPISGTNIRKLQCKIRAIQTHLQLENCIGYDNGKGKLTLAGEINLPVNSQRGKVDLELNARNAQVIHRHDIESQTSGNIRLHGDFDSLLAEGELDVAPLTAIIDVNHSSGIPKIKTTVIDEEQTQATQNEVAQTSPSLLTPPKITLDLIISAQKQAYLRGHGLEAELQGKINLRGLASKPNYDGEFETVRGTFEIFGKKFTINQGIVNFNNDVIGLNIEAEYSKAEQTIVATISGTASKLKVEFSATPEMPEGEILAFIIFGKSIQKMTPVEAVQLAIAVQNLRGGSQFIDPIAKAREILGVDTLSIENNDEASDDDGLSVGVGKYINEKVYLELTRTSNSSQPWKSTLEIELTPNIQLQSSSGGETGLEGLELRWKRDY